ncbi:MAG TPA: DNA polymerase III subunit delta [Cytophagales bacterium]|nr:DNA polymerase III subunit delta [Cytophagales bacterium]HAP59593.1 DNA polymerase III subunit delta [Cytophagales bacterium]
MRFSAIPGHTGIKQTLLSAVQRNHVAHAQLFVGPEGSATLPLALAYLTYLNCENPSGIDSCGECPSCVKMDKYIHPDLHFVMPVSSTKQVTGKDVVSQSFLKEWREFLVESPYGSVEDWAFAYGGENKQVNISREESRQIIRNLSLKAFEGRYKAMLIWLPEYMHPSAANGILKILEEPPERTVFILVTQDTEKLLTTILSRTQKVQVPGFSDEEVAQILETEYEATDTQARQVAHLAEGNLSAARKLLSQVEDDSHALFRDWMRLCYVWDFTKLVTWSDDYQKMSKASQRTVLQYGINLLRESLMSSAGVEDLIRLFGEEVEFVKNFGKVLDADKIAGMYEVLNRMLYYLERNASPKIQMMNLSMKLARILRG